MSEQQRDETNDPREAPRGFSQGFPGGFRVFTVGRETAQRFRVKPPWKVRAGASVFERIIVGALTFVLALPVAFLLLILGVLLLCAFLGCGVVLLALVLAACLARGVFNMLFGGLIFLSKRPGASASTSAGRENVRVLPRQDPRA